MIARLLRAGVALGLVCLMFGVEQARADIYNCTVNGVKTFSETPCGADAKIIKTQGERMVSFGSGMSPDDIEFFCTLIMRGHDDYVASVSNSTRRLPSYYNRYTGTYWWVGTTYTSPDQGAAAAVENYILSHISNLHELARNDPSVYRYVVQMAGSSEAGSRNSPVDTDREAAQSECQDQVSRFLQSQPKH